MLDITREAKTNVETTFFYVNLHMDVPEFANQQRLTYISFVWTQYTA